MRKVLLFLISIVFAGIFAALGSMIGHLAGHIGVMVGGALGGLAGVTVATRVAVRARWIRAIDFATTATGGEIGFIVAAFIAVKTLHSPVGPILSTLLVGIGSLAGLAISERRSGPLRR